MTILKNLDIPLLLGFLLLVILLQASHELGSSGVAVERLQLSDSYDTPATRYTSVASNRRAVVAILVHGKQCNRAMMTQLARYLAAGGVVVFTIDLPGHGESQNSFTLEKALSATESAVVDIVERTKVRAENLVLIGHSFGATVLSPAASRRDVLATVFVGPGRTGGLTRQRPNNVLITTAEHDYDSIKLYAQAMYHDLTAGERQLPGNLVGDFQMHNARLWEVIPGVEHVNLLFNQRVYRLVAEWIERSSNGSVSLQSSYSINTAQRAALAALALSLMLAVLISRYFSRSGNTAIHNPARTWVRPATAIVGGLFFAVVVTRRKVPLQFLRLDEGEILVSLLALTGIVGLGLLVAQDKKMSWRLTARDLIVAALAFLCLNGLALLTIDREFYSLRLVLGDWNRLMALGLTAVLAVPFFMLQDDLLRRLQGASGSAFREFMISCGGPLFVIAMLCLGIYFIGPKLFRFSPAIAGLLAYCAFASALMRLPNKSTSAGVVFSSLVTAWIISVGFLRY